MADVLESILGVPQAVGGGALDLLIGDRTNVPAGEQVKRGIQALLFAGDNPGNLIALRQMNERQNAQNQAIVASPDFQRSLEINQMTQNLSPMDAFAFTAKQYGVRGYSPDTRQGAVDLAPGGPSAPERQTMPVLPPPSIEDLLTNETQRYQLGRITDPDEVERESALAQASGMHPTLGRQLEVVDRVLGRAAKEGETTSTLSVSGGGEVSAKVQTLKGGERWYADASDADDAVTTWNAAQERIGLPDRLVAIPLQSGGAILKQTSDPEAAAAAGASGRIRGEAEGKDSPTRLGGKTPRQRETDAAVVQAQKEYDTRVAPFLKLVDKMEANLTALPEKGGGIVGAIGGRAQAALGNALPQAYPEQRALTEAGDAAAVMITDLYGGKGAQSDRDIMLMTGQVPRVGVHTQPIGRAKLQELRAAVAARRPGAAAAPAEAPANTIQTKSGRTIIYEE